jgi:hypothetical protein
MNGIANRLESLGGAGAAIFNRMGTSARIYASIIRSCGNVYAVQKVRDRNAGKLEGPPKVWPKVGDWYGAPDLQLLNEFIRDEMDNTVELVRLLEAGGLRQILTATNPADEDPFLLGPDLVSQLKLKCNIMQRHWLDAEAYLAPPHK